MAPQIMVHVDPPSPVSAEVTIHEDGDTDQDSGKAGSSEDKPVHITVKRPGQDKVFGLEFPRHVRKRDEC